MPRLRRASGSQRANQKRKCYQASLSSAQEPRQQSAIQVRRNQLRARIAKLRQNQIYRRNENNNTRRRLQAYRRTASFRATESYRQQQIREILRRQRERVDQLRSLRSEENRTEGNCIIDLANDFNRISVFERATEAEEFSNHLVPPTADEWQQHLDFLAPFARLAGRGVPTVQEIRRTHAVNTDDIIEVRCPASDSEVPAIPEVFQRFYENPNARILTRLSEFPDPIHVEDYPLNLAFRLRNEIIQHNNQQQNNPGTSRPLQLERALLDEDFGVGPVNYQAQEPEEDTDYLEDLDNSNSDSDDDTEYLLVNIPLGNDLTLQNGNEQQQRSKWWETLELRRVIPIKLDWNKICASCQSRQLNSERVRSCCGRSEIFKNYRNAPILPPVPPALLELYQEPGFSAKSRQYNALFSLSSIGVEGHFVNFPDGISYVSINGRIYHRILPGQTDHTPLRYFLYDASERLEDARGRNLNEGYVNTILQVLENTNFLVQRLRQLRNEATPNLCLRLNTPTSGEEIAAIINIDNTTTPGDRVILIHYQSEEQPSFVSSLSPLYEPLQYPLIYTHGTKGWGIKPHTRGLTQLQYYRMLLYQEERFQLLGRLANEYLVDMYSRVEEERLWYIRNNQPKETDGDEMILAEGGRSDDPRNVYLPTSFLCSKRWSSQQTADALTICTRFGKPTFFITMTTDPNWPEIRSQLRAGQNYTDIPFVVARVYHEKLTKVKKYIKDKFGGLIYRLNVTEFQKRGLPHTHFAIQIAQEPRTPEEIDQVVQAEVPENNPKLKELVLKYMVHKCTTRCKKEDGTCRYGYPKPITPVTSIDRRGYPIYRRRKPEDLLIVPYNPHLLVLAQCHMNVEIAHSVNLIMYLYKYIYKGADTTRFRVVDENGVSVPVDEILDYIKARFISAPEAVWRLLRFHIQEKTPTVECLNIHLPDKKKNFQSSNKDTLSQLERYFYRPKTAEIEAMKYVEYNEKCIFYPEKDCRGKEGFVFEVRVRGCAVRGVKLRGGCKFARITTYYPAAAELFYLRLLLLHNAATSFEELRTVNGTTHDTFQEAALQLGLVTNENEGDYCMHEAITNLHSPAQLIFLFCLLILEGAPAIPLFDKYRANLVQDYEEIHEDQDEIQELLLRYICQIVEERGKTMEDYGLPNPEIRASEAALNQEAWNNREDEQLESYVLKESTFNDEQRQNFIVIKEAIENKRGLFTLVSGRAGRGKTFFTRAVCEYARSKGKIVLPCATSAFAASNYEGGLTAHSLFNLPVEDSNEMIRSMCQQGSERWGLLKQCTIIIWDEIFMANKAAVEAANDLMQAVMGNRRPFGGKIFVGLGDKRQPPPVVRNGGKTSVIAASIQTSGLYPTFQQLTLNQPMRDAEDPDWSQFVDEVGDGIGGEFATIKLLEVSRNEDEALNWIYPDEVLNEPEQCIYRSVLSTLNANVDRINKKVLDRLPGEERTSYSVDSIKEADGRAVTENQFATNDFLNSLTSSGVPGHVLKLKVGAQCTILKTLTTRELTKQTRVVVRTIGQRYIEVETIGEVSARHLIPKHAFFFQLPFNSWTVYRTQFPLRLAYANTYHSCIGLTLHRAVFDLREPVFSHGLLYMGLTRIRKRQDGLLLVKADIPEEEGGGIKVKNIVYQELLQ